AALICRRRWTGQVDHAIDGWAPGQERQSSTKASVVRRRHRPRIGGAWRPCLPPSTGGLMAWGDRISDTVTFVRLAVPELYLPPPELAQAIVVTGLRGKVARGFDHNSANRWGRGAQVLQAHLHGLMSVSKIGGLHRGAGGARTGRRCARCIEWESHD